MSSNSASTGRMLRHAFRSFVSLLLVFTMLGMVAPRTALAIPIGPGVMSHPMSAPQGRMQIVKDMASGYVTVQAVSHHHQHNMCGCAAPCCTCSVCQASVPVRSVSDPNDKFIAPTEPDDLNLADVTIPLDPRPPRV